MNHTPSDHRRHFWGTWCALSKHSASSRPSGLVHFLFVLLLTVGGDVYETARAQENPAAAGGTTPSESEANSEGSFSRSITFARDRDMEMRLRGALTALKAGHPVDCIQILTELLALPEPHNVQIGASLRDVRDEAANQLRHGSPELREQFQRQTEVQARDELRQALEQRNYEAIAHIVTKYPFTPVAQEASEILASQFYDHGRFDLVTVTASRWIDHSPDPQEAAQRSPRLVELWIQTLHELGDVRSATQLAERFTGRKSDSPEIPSGTDEQQPVINPTATDQLASWTVHSEIPASVVEFLRTVVNNLSRQGIHPSLATQPLVLKEHIVWRSLTEIICMNRHSGQVIWRHPIKDPTVDGIVEMGETKADGNRILNLRAQIGHRLLRNSILGQVTCDGERVYTVEYTGAMNFTPEHQEQKGPNNRLSDGDRMPIPKLAYAAYSLADGQVLWRSNEVWGADAPDYSYLFGPPTRQGKSLYSVVQKSEQLLILRMDPVTGALDGASVLGEVPYLADDRRRMSEASPILWHQGVAICASGAGGIAAFDVVRGQLQWGFRHSRDDVVISQGLLMPVIDKSGWTWMTGWEQPQLFRIGTHLVYGSPETNLLRCLDIVTGDLHWEVPITGTRSIIGGDQDRIIIAGPGIVRSLRLADGSLEREFVAPSPIATSTWVEPECRVVLKNRQRFAWNPQSGNVKSSGQITSATPLLHKVGTLHPIQGDSERSLSLNLLANDQMVTAHMDEISSRPDIDMTDQNAASQDVPPELVWRPGHTTEWIAEVTPWISMQPEGERAVHVTRILAQCETALLSDELFDLPIRDWASGWGLSADQVRELAIRSLKHSMRINDRSAALRHVLHLLELNPAGWEIELDHAQWGPFTVGAEPSVTRTVRLDAALRGVVEQLWDQAPPAQREELATIYREWASRESTILDELTQPLEQLSFLPPPVKERPLQWKTLGELAREQLSLRHLSNHSDRTTAASALWRLVELYMARGEWGNAAGMIEQLKRRFASVAIRGNQTAEELVRQLPENSLVRKSIDQDRRTIWPEREPVVTTTTTARGPENQTPIPVQSDRGSIFDQLNLRYATRQLSFSGLGKVNRSWTLTVPAGNRNLAQQYPSINAGWAFGQFVVVQVGSMLYSVSSLDSKGEPKTTRTKEVMLWPTSPQGLIDTLGNEDNGVSFEDRPIAQAFGFVRRAIEPFDCHGHRVTWVGPVSAGTLCFLQQGMLVCLDTASGQELWRRYDVPEGVRTVGDDSVVIMLRDDRHTVDLLSPIDGRRLRSYEAIRRGGEWVRHWGRLALAATGQPSPGSILTPKAPPEVNTPEATPAEKPVELPPQQELQLQMVDLAGPQTLWERTFPAGSAAFEVDEDWLGVLSMDGTLQFVDVQTGQTVSQAKVALPAGLSQIATAVTERSIFVTLSSTVTEDALIDPAKLRYRQFFVNGPVHAFDRRTGEPQWSQQIENRVFPIDQVRDIPLLICADVWKGPLESKPRVGEIFPKLEELVQKPDDPNAVRVRYWALDSRTGRVVLDTAVEKSLVQYTVERNLSEKWVEIRLGGTTFKFSYADEESGGRK